jgi:hypothetical protein
MLLKKLPFRLFPLMVTAFVLAISSLATAQTSPLSAEAKPVANRLTQPINETRLVSLRGTVHPLARAANDRGAAPDGMRLDRIQIVLKRSDAQESALKQLIGDLHKPGTASYHRWLTPEQFGQQFGPSDSDLATLETWLQSHGFGDIKVNPGRQTLEVAGSVAQFREAFHTQIHKYSVKGETHYANAADPQIPAAIAPVFGGFASLNNFRLTSHSKVMGKAAYDIKSGSAKPQWTMSASYGNSFVVSPGDFAVQYDLNPLYNAGTNGAGQTIAIVNDSNIDLTIANSFRSLFGLPVNPPQVIIDGNDPGIDGINNPDGLNNASGEAYLDVEWAGAVAPNATIDLVIAADTTLNSGLILAAGHAVYGNIAPIISLSFGACEADLGTENQYLNSLWEQAAAQGITVAVSTGDSGSANCDNPDTQDYAVNGQAISGFASTPYNVAVGGTDFYYSSFQQGETAINAQLATYWDITPTNSSAGVSIKGFIPEQAWNNSQYGSNILVSATGETTIAAGSGGASTLGLVTGPYPKPAWQTGNGVPADGVRDIPDVSLFAASGFNASFYPVCGADGDCQPVSSGSTVQIEGVGGTSASTPAFAAMMALVNQKYGRQGQADYILYPMATQFPAVFHDVVQGTNSVPCATGSTGCITVASPVTDIDGTLEGQIGAGSLPQYNATTGYDLATGLGSLDANALLTNWQNVKFASSTTTLTPSSTNITHGQTITFSGAVTASTTPTGSVALMSDSTEPLQGGQTLFELSNGTFSGTYNALPGGTYNIWGQYSGDGVNAASKSTTTQITVVPEASQVQFGIFNVIGQSTNTGAQVPYGTQLILTALPSPSSGTTSYGIPTGSVVFADGASNLSTVQVNSNGEAAYNAPLGIGAHSLVANYSGDNSYSKSSSTAVALTVVQDTPTLGFSSTAQTGPTTFQGGGPIVFTVKVENGANNQIEQIYGTYIYTPAAPPSGTVTISGLPAGVPSGVPLQSTLDLGTGFPEGVGTLTAASLAAGTYNIKIIYPGDANYNAITGSSTITILGSSLLASTTTASSSAVSTSPAAAVNITATVAGQMGKNAPTGTVTIGTSGYDIAQVKLAAVGGDLSSAVFAFNSAALLPGANTLTVQYSGDSVYQPSSTTVSITNGTGPGTQGFALAAAPVNITSPGSSAASTITVAPSNGFTGNVVFTCTVTPPSGVTDVPTCSAASVAVTGDLPVNGTLTINTDAALPAGTYTLNILGTSGAVTASTSIPVVLAVPAVPGFALSSSPITITTAGMTGTSTITVTPSNAFTGTVALACSVASSTLSDPPTCSVSAPPAITGTTAVTATLTVATSSDTAPGSYTVNVSGTSGTLSQGTSVSVTVTGPAPVPSFALSSVAITNVTPGTPATSTITVTPSGGFTGAVALACAVTTSPTGATEAPTCSVTAPPAIAGTTAVTATLTVNSTAATTAALGNQLPRSFVMGSGAAIASLFFLLLPNRRRRLSLLLSLITLAVFAGAMVGCGGGSTAPSSTGSGNAGTTPGAYVITITGTSGTVSQTTAVNVSLN